MSEINDFSKLDRTATARALGVTPRTVSRHRRSGCPRNPDGTYDLPAVVSWLVDRTRRAAGQNESDDSQRWLARFREERTGVIKLQREALEGRLLPRERVVEQFTARAFEFSRALQLLPRRISSTLAIKSKRTVKDVEAIVEGECRAILLSYSRPIAIDGHTIENAYSRTVSPDNHKGGNT